MRASSAGAMLASPLIEPLPPATMMGATYCSAPLRMASCGNALASDKPLSRLPLLSFTPITWPGYRSAKVRMLSWLNATLDSPGIW